MVDKSLITDRSSEDLFQSAIDAALAGVTGLLASDRKDVTLSLGHLLQKSRAVGFLHALKLEWDDLKRKGGIQDKFIGSELHEVCLQEMLDCLDEEIPDQVRFSFMKNLFLSFACSTGENESVFKQQLFRVARSLSSGEIIVLTTVFTFPRRGITVSNDAVQWVGNVTGFSGLRQKELVENIEETLVRKRLLTERSLMDRSGVFESPSHRLTGLALELLKTIDSFKTVEV